MGIIDEGPEGGKKSGELSFEGLPEDLVRCERSAIGKYLKKVFETF
jgi:excinuclease ABC subunit A